MICTKDWAFIHIPKTSGTNLKKRALEYYKNSSYIEEHHDSIISETMHNPYVYWRNTLRNKWTFSILRNPFTRAVSLWKYCIEERPAFQKNFGYNNFYEFYTNEKIKIWEGKVWGVQTPQFDFIKNQENSIEIDVFKMENELHILESKLNFKFTNSKINSLAPYNYKEIYKDKKNIKLIQEIFYIDFKMFNYDIKKI